MLEAVLGLVIVALLVERYLSNRAQAQERQRLVNAVLAKTPGELAVLNREPVRTPPEPRQTLEGFEGIAGLGG